MKIAVAREIDPSEPRVAVSPDTVKKYKAAGRRRRDRGRAPASSRACRISEFTAVGATVSADALRGRRHHHQGVKRPEASETRAIPTRRAGHRHHGSLRQ